MEIRGKRRARPALTGGQAVVWYNLPAVQDLSGGKLLFLQGKEDERQTEILGTPRQ
jgi:hypothetical protein